MIADGLAKEFMQKTEAVAQDRYVNSQWIPPLPHHKEWMIVENIKQQMYNSITDEKGHKYWIIYKQRYNNDT